MISRRSALLTLLLAGLLCSFCALAQGQLQPLGNPPVPPQNPQTTAKINLGKILFWEEQLSLTGTVACGSCHRPDAAGSDPRSLFQQAGNVNPGPDGIFGTTDDIQASPGVPAHGGDGAYQFSTRFGLSPQVGGRRAQSAINSAYPPLLFWDGRAGGTFSDPISNLVLIPQGAALENQALGPLLDSSEMAPMGAQAAAIASRIAQAKPLALATDIPAALVSWMNGRNYPALFQEVFGSPSLDAAKIAMAIASYERTLNANQALIDQQFGGTPVLNAQEIQGQQVFIGSNCAVCHGGNRFTDDDFHYIGVRPATDDLGRFARTGINTDRGKFRTPSLRNVALRAPYMHNGRFATLEDVIDFYNRGGDFNAPNKDPNVQPLGLSPTQRAALAAFLRRPLTDTRVAAEQAPFDRPTLYTESSRVPQITGSAAPGSGAIAPSITAIEPPLLGNTNFTVGVSGALGGALATLVVNSSDPGIQSTIPSGDFATLTTTLSGSGFGTGAGSVQIDLGNNYALIGSTLYGRFYIADPGAANGWSVTPAFRITVFGEIADVLMIDGFE